MAWSAIQVQGAWLSLHGREEVVGRETQGNKAAGSGDVLGGLGFRSMGRILKISHVTVYYWVRDWGDKVGPPSRDGPVEIVELDEMHSYVGNKKTTVARLPDRQGYGLLLIDLERGTSILSVGAARRKQG